MQRRLWAWSRPHRPLLKRFSLRKPLPCPSGLALHEGWGTAVSSALEAPLCKRWARPDCSSHTRCTLTHTPNASQLDRAVCKTQHQPNEKHIASQKKLRGQKRAAQLPGTLDRASEPSWREEGQPCPSAHPCPPHFPAVGSPGLCLPSWGGWSFGSQMWSASLCKGGEQKERERENGLGNQTDGDTGIWVPPLAHRLCDLGRVSEPL